MSEHILYIIDILGDHEKIIDNPPTNNLDVAKKLIEDCYSINKDKYKYRISVYEPGIDIYQLSCQVYYNGKTWIKKEYNKNMIRT